VDKCRVGRSVLAAVGAVLIAPPGAVTTALVVNTYTTNTALVVAMGAVTAGKCRVGRFHMCS
jgi:adenosylcobinamide amidohydrolase